MPPQTPPVGRVPMYARDPLTGDIYEVGGGGTNEVFIGGTDPYGTAGATDELWLDTSQTPPILKGRVNNAWVEVTAATQPEVIVGGTIPSPGDDKLWLDPGGVMVPPTPGDPIKAMWAYDATAGPTNGWHKVEVGGGDEVVVQPEDPDIADPGNKLELWYDTDDPASGTPDEVFIGPDDPRILNPANQHELWYDTDAVSLTAGEFLASDTDPRDDPSGQTVELWLDTRSDPPVLKFWATEILPHGWQAVTDWSYLPLSGGTMQSGATINFPNTEGNKIFLYGSQGGASNFGLGIDAGSMTIFTGQGGKVSFRQNDAESTTEFGLVNASGFYTNAAQPSGGNSLARKDYVDSRPTTRANSAFMSLGDFNLTGSYSTIYNTPFNYPSGNRRIKVTVQLKVIPGGSQHVLVKCFGQEVSLEKMASITDSIGPAVFIQNAASSTSTAVQVEIKADTGNGSVDGDGSSWILVEDLGPR